MGALPVKLLIHVSGVGVVKCVVDACYMISCVLLSTGLNRAALQETPSPLILLQCKLKKNRTAFSFLSICLNKLM